MVGWEVFEYVFGMVNINNYVTDTVQDFIFGSLGGLVVYFLNKSRTNRSVE